MLNREVSVLQILSEQNSEQASSAEGGGGGFQSMADAEMAA